MVSVLRGCIVSQSLCYPDADLIHCRRESARMVYIYSSAWGLDLLALTERLYQSRYP